MTEPACSYEPPPDPATTEELATLLYETLRRLAQRQLAREGGSRITLQPTALVHEAYLKLAASSRWENRAHFVAAAARAMREVLVDRARRRLAAKHGALAAPIALEAIDEPAAARPPVIDVLLLDEALQDLEKMDARAAEVVVLRCFGGLGVDEVASVLGISARTVKREWQIARLWLIDRLDEKDEKDEKEEGRS